MTIDKVLRGDIFLVNLDPVIGSEQGKTRPVLVVQNDVGNEHSPVTIVAAITSKLYPQEYPFIVKLTAEESGLTYDSSVLLNQIRTIDKKRLIKKLTHLDKEIMQKIDDALKVSLGLPNI